VGGPLDEHRRPAGDERAYAGSTGDVYAATDFGVLRRPAGSIDWEVAAADLPQVAVYGLTLS